MWSQAQGALLLTAIAGWVSPASALRVPLTRRDRSTFPGSQLSRREVDISNNQHAFILHNTNDLVYAGNITIAGQNVIVNLDTGSADLWVYLPDQPQLTDSTSIIGNLSYAIGSVEGPINFAALEFAGFSVPSQAFIDVTQAANMDAIFNSGASGILGLGFDATNSVINEKFSRAFGPTTTLGRSPIANIFYQNMTLPNFFTLLLGRTNDPDDERAGVFTISEYISEFSAVGESPKLTSQTPDHWSVLVDGFKVGGRSLPVHPSIATVPRGKAVAVLDSGFSLPPIPSTMVDAIYGAIPGSMRISEDPTFEGSGIDWIIPCNQSTELSFTIGGRDFPVHPLDLTTIQTSTDIVKGTNITFCTNTYQSIKIGGDFDMILGDAFLKNAYVSFDYGSFNKQGHLTEQPFIQLLPTTDSKEALAEFTAIRAKALEGTVELAPSELRILAMQQNPNADASDGPSDEAPEISGVLAAADDGTSLADGAAASAIQKYGPIVVGLLAGNLLILVVICVLGLYFCISRNGRNKKSASATYHPVKLQKENSAFMEPVSETRYDS